MSIIYIFRDSWADIVLALNISLGFVALIITLFIIIRLRNKIYDNKKKKSSAGIKHNELQKFKAMLREACSTDHTCSIRSSPCKVKPA